MNEPEFSGPLALQVRGGGGHGRVLDWLSSSPWERGRYAEDRDQFACVINGPALADCR